MDFGVKDGVRYYKGDIQPGDGVVFVFGSNPEGRHGAGAAKVARERFGAEYGRGEGLQGNAYALPTKDISSHGFARYDTRGYEVSSRGDRRFSAMNALFAPGTVLFGHDVGGRSIESVYQHGVKQGDWVSVDNFKTGRPTDRTIIKGYTEDDSFYQGYLPLWKEWARQNPVLMEELRRNTVGRVLTDSFASTRVSQARALSEILNDNNHLRSIPAGTIVESIRKLYETARQNPDRTFCIAYRNTDSASLNGYTGIEMMRMFAAAGPLPENILVSEEWAETGILMKNAESEFLTEGNESILKQYDANKVVTPGVNLAVDTRMDDVRDWFEIVNDNGERLVRAANFVTGELRNYESAHFENAVVNTDGSVSLDAVAHVIYPEGEVETSETMYHVTFTREELMEMTGEGISDGQFLIRNSDGTPKVLWHGSPAEFDEFDFSHAGENTGIVEYTNRVTGEKVISDSDKALFFTDNRELAISYAFLARTQQLSRYSDLLTDIGSLLNNPEGSILSRIHSKAEFIDAVGELRKEGDSEMNAVLDTLPDLTADKPISSMEASARMALAKAVFEVRNRYSELHRKNSRGGLSNQLNNFVRQKDYLAYFAENLDRLCANDPTVRTEFNKDFNSYSVFFFGPDHGSGISVFLESETRRMKAAEPYKDPVYLDTLTPSGKKELLQKIEDDLNACIERYNKDIETAGFRQNSHLYPVHIKSKNALEHDYHGSSFPDKYKPNEKYGTAYIAARQVKKALADGNDAVVYKNIRDPFLGTTYGVFSKDNIVMVDRSLFPKEQLDCTLGKVSGTVQSYMESMEKNDEKENGMDLYSCLEKPEKITLIVQSGGARGADEAFGNAVAELGGIVNHWYAGERTENNAPLGNVMISPDDYEEGRHEAAAAARYNWGYSYSVMKDPRLIRDWAQVKYSDAVVAVSHIVRAGERVFPDQKYDTRVAVVSCVTGGTGYAVGMAVLHGKPVFVFDQKDENWYKFDYLSRDFLQVDKPEVYRNFAGIGSRNLTDSGRKAIEAYVRSVAISLKEDTSERYVPEHSMVESNTVSLVEKMKDSREAMAFVSESGFTRNDDPLVLAKLVGYYYGVKGKSVESCEFFFRDNRISGEGVLDTVREQFFKGREDLGKGQDNEIKNIKVKKI